MSCGRSRVASSLIPNEEPGETRPDGTCTGDILGVECENKEVISSAQSYRSEDPVGAACIATGSNAEKGTPALINQLYVSETEASCELPLMSETDGDAGLDIELQVSTA